MSNEEAARLAYRSLIICKRMDCVKHTCTACELSKAIIRMAKELTLSASVN